MLEPVGIGTLKALRAFADWMHGDRSGGPEGIDFLIAELLICMRCDLESEEAA